MKSTRVSVFLVGIGKDTTEADIDAVAKRLLTLVCLKMRMANLI